MFAPEPMGWRYGGVSDPSPRHSPAGRRTGSPTSASSEQPHSQFPISNEIEADIKQRKRRRRTKCHPLEPLPGGSALTAGTRVRSKNPGAGEKMVQNGTRGRADSAQPCDWSCDRGVLTPRHFSDFPSIKRGAASAASAGSTRGSGGTASTCGPVSRSLGQPEGRSGLMPSRNVNARNISPAGTRVTAEACPLVSVRSRGIAFLLACLIILPWSLLILFTPTLYTQLSPSTQQLMLFLLPALRSWKGQDRPVRQDLSSIAVGEALKPLIHTTDFSSQSENTRLPAADTLREEFSPYTEGALPVPAPLKQHTEEFKREIMEVYENIYVAVGFGLANCIIIDGPSGVVLIDAMESIETMTEVWTAWNKKRDQKEQTKRSGSHSLGPGVELPKEERRRVRGIIYTHFHTDHTFGAAAVFEPDYTEVHAHWLTKLEMEKVLTVTSGSTYRRSMRQFGVFVDPQDYVNAGIGPYLRYSSGINQHSNTQGNSSNGTQTSSRIGTILPTHIMSGQRKEIELAGVRLVLLHAPGESRDQTIVWLPESRVLVGADNIYKALPNIYAIRGTETRSCSDWVASLDLMRSLRAEVLLLGHTQPLTGEKLIYETLTAYRDTIQFIHDQTVRLMNKGMPVNDIAHVIELPNHLKMHPYLQQHYGLLQWAIRAVFAHYMGWFGGSPEGLSPMTSIERAEALQHLAGGYNLLLQHAISALRGGHHQWALELSSAAQTLTPDCEIAKIVRVIALRALAARVPAASGRNWYLTAALEAEGKAKLALSDTQKREVLQRLSIEQIFSLMPVRIEPRAAEAIDSVILFVFEDQFIPSDPHERSNTHLPQQRQDVERQHGPGPRNEVGSGVTQGDMRQPKDEATGHQTHTVQQRVPLHQCVHFRRGVVYTRRTCEREADVTVETTAAAWLRILTKDVSAVTAAMRGEIKIRGSLMVLLQSLSVVELDVD